MLKFFRSIRKGLLSEGKTSKYFKYAIGEIILVVLGILIALQLNTWNQNRQDRIQEQQILVQLLNEYENNLIQMNQKIFIRNETILSAYKLLQYKNDEMLYISSKDTAIHPINNMDISAFYCQGVRFRLLNSFEGTGALNTEIGLM